MAFFLFLAGGLAERGGELIAHLLRRRRTPSLRSSRAW